MTERQPLDIIRERVAIGNRFDLVTGNVPLQGEGEMTRIMFNIPSSARSELVITPEQNQILQYRISQIRRWLGENGLPGNLHPDFEESIAPKGMEKMRWYLGNPYDILAYDPPEDPALMLITNDENADTYIEIGHTGHYGLAVHLSNNGDNYYSGVRPLEEMTDEEYVVIRQCLDQFLQTPKSLIPSH